MTVSIIGTRGIPAMYGGFETFAEEISWRLSEKGHKVLVQCEKLSPGYQHVMGVELWATGVRKGKHPLLYYLIGIWKGLRKSDVLIVAGTGGSLFYLLNFFFRRIIITNPDGIESIRQKWSYFTRKFIKTSEITAVKLSDKLIADSAGIMDYLKAKYQEAARKTELIEYGARKSNSGNPHLLDKYGLKSGSFYLVVCRLEPENNLEMIISGCKMSGSNFPLVIAGNTEYSSYSRKLRETHEGPDVIFIGPVYNRDEIDVLRHSCRLYIHGHSVGGTNPSLLEAMECGSFALCYDNVFNREVTRNKVPYFNSQEKLGEIINESESMDESERSHIKETLKNLISTYYNWDRVTREYDRIIREATESY